ncbi:MAG: hypothetical protein HYV26_03280 [Candidatus Hydrogenedentes bacterium]|nr:hypothetical protein [Candidatus Hydrogenedentota bacterium]
MRKGEIVAFGLALFAIAGCVQSESKANQVEQPANFLSTTVALKIDDMSLTDAMGMLTQAHKFQYTVEESARSTAESATIKYVSASGEPLGEVLTSMLAPLGLTYFYDASSEQLVLKLAPQG